MDAEQPRRVLTRCDGQQLRAVAETAAAWLAAHAHEVDALNVYPVPDGDTGANMTQTMRAAVEAAPSGQADAGTVAARLAHGALMGARGNSGVILSQLLRGLAHALDSQRTFTPPDLAVALRDASATAYRAVTKPVEGTVLTVSRVAAEAAEQAAAERPEFIYVLERTVAAARRALAETRYQLPVLRQAGVIDAGGRGYLLLLEGALRHLQGKRDVPQPDFAAAREVTRAGAALHAQFAHAESGFGYCTEFVIVGADLREAEVRARLAEMGDSLLVVGEPTLLRVHIHTEDPGKAMSYAGSLGRLRLVKVQDMQEQHDEFVAETAPAGTEGAAPSGQADALPLGVIAVAAGDGFAAILASLGAVVVSGGQTMNPSTQQLLEKIDACPQDTVIVLPNNGNVVLTAQQAAGLSGKRVHVLPTQTVPQGIAALLAVRYDEETETILAAMREAATLVRTAELTTAVRAAEMDGLQVRRGDVLGLLDGKLAAAGADEGSVLSDLLDRMPADRYEMATIYAGAEATARQREALASLLARRYPNLQVEQAEGGQPHYQFIVSVE